ncbi:MAG: hypothetical protein IKA76_00320, partial [Clostridia bacterium]|nr:hypothetical protein [Clostridia bacterium]
SSEISVRFDFSINADTLLERFSHYAVVLRSPRGERLLAADPQYAEVVSNDSEQTSDRFFFKGLASSNISLGGNLGVGTAVIPVYLDRLLSTSSQGYIHSLGDTIVYFNKEYMDALDHSLRTYSASGSRVYLQFLLTANGSDLSVSNGKMIGASYDMPNLFSEAVLVKICAATEFLAERYAQEQMGSFHGVILGCSIDDPMMNYCGTFSHDRYAEIYALYLTAVANFLRTVSPTADLVIPFSADNSYGDGEANGASYHAGRLLEKILQIQDDGFSVPFSCSTMICMDMDQASSNKWTADTVHLYSSYFKSLRSRYESAPLHYTVCWEIPDSMGVNAAGANYAYSYYKLIRDPQISSFVISFLREEAKERERLSEFKQLLRYIDTKDSISVTTPFLSYFGRSSWDQVIDGATQKNYAVRSEYSGTVAVSDTGRFSGSFPYIDFSSGDLDGWFSDTSGADLRLDYGTGGARVLKGTLSFRPSEEYGEILYLYEFPERFSHTPYIQLRMELNDDEEEEARPYQIVVALGNPQHRVTAQTIVNVGEPSTVGMDLRAFPKDQLMTYLNISIRPLNGDSETVTVRLYDVIGYSEQQSSDELRERIEEDRAEIRDMTHVSDGDTEEQKWWIVGLVALIVSVVIGILICFRREDESEQDEKPQDNE